MFLLWLRQFPWCGDWTPASVLPPAEGRSSPSNTPVFPPSSFILLSFAWFCIFLSTGQVLLSALSWCSVCTSVSEGVFLMYPWRDVLHVHLLLHHRVLPVFVFFWHMYICNFFFKFFFVFLNSTYFWLSFLHLHCCAWFSLVAASRDSFSLQCMSFTLW